MAEGLSAYWFHGASTEKNKAWDNMSSTVPELAASFGVPGSNNPEHWAAFGKLPLFSEPGTEYEHHPHTPEVQKARAHTRSLRWRTPSNLHACQIVLRILCSGTNCIVHLLSVRAVPYAEV